MTRQRLADAAKFSSGAAGGGSGGNGPMKPGDVRIVEVKDGHGSIIKTITIHRTNRPYAEDLCEAYNAAMSQGARDRGLEYRVLNGEVKLGYSYEFSAAHTKHLERQAESERQQWLRNNKREV